MTGEKDPRDVMQAEHDAGLSEHPAFRAPAEMPGVEEIHAAFVEAQRQYRAERDAALAKQGYWPDRSPAPLDVLAKVAQALFAPILAEKERDNRQLRLEVAEERETSRISIYGWRDKANEMEARALAAEAALAAERERCAKVAERFMAAGKFIEGQFVAGPNTQFAIAAAIRAQGE